MDHNVKHSINLKNFFPTEEEIKKAKLKYAKDYFRKLERTPGYHFQKGVEWLLTYMQGKTPMNLH